MQDGEIIRLFREGNRERAFTEIVKAYSERLFWYVRRYVSSHEDADDLVQDIFIKIWAALPSFRGESQLFTWLYRIAYNESITYIKQKHQALSIDDEDVTIEAQFVADEYFDGDETQKLLTEAISTLPAKQKMVFCMKYFEEKKYEEISDIVGTSIGALKASYHIAVEKITKYIKTKEV